MSQVTQIQTRAIAKFMTGLVILLLGCGLIVGGINVVNGVHVRPDPRAGGLVITIGVELCAISYVVCRKLARGDLFKLAVNTCLIVVGLAGLVGILRRDSGSAHPLWLDSLLVLLSIGNLLFVNAIVHDRQTRQ